MSKMKEEGEGADPSRELPQQRLDSSIFFGKDGHWPAGDRRRLAGGTVKWPVRTGVGSPTTLSHAGSS
jgi:hypothetical protein